MTDNRKNIHCICGHCFPGPTGSMCNGKEMTEQKYSKNSIESRFEIFTNEFLIFEKVEPKLSGRPDLHAFMMLDKLFPGKRDIICHSEHDEIQLDIENEDIEKLTDEQILELVRCGVYYDGCLRMFT